MKSGKMIITRNSSRAKRGLGAAVPALAALIAVFAAAVFTVEARAESAVSVLCYHSFLEKKKMDPFSFNIDELNSQITQLKKEGFRFVSINDVIAGRITGTKNILVTVDDGNKSVYEAHRRVFRPNGIRPLLGIYPNIIINKKHYALTWEQLQDLAKNGCDIAAHGYFHLKVNKKLHDKNPAYFKKEIFLVKKVLEEKLNRKITAYIYPFGLRDDMTIRALKEAGYRHAFTINNGRIDIPLAAGGDRPFELPRYMVTRTNWKYCFNSVMKNARHKTAYKVAAADEPSADKADVAAMSRPPAERHDPAAELAARLTERMDKTAMADLKQEKNSKPTKDAGAKKKIEKKTGIGPDTAVSQEIKGPERGSPAKIAKEKPKKRPGDAGTAMVSGPAKKDKKISPADVSSPQKEKPIIVVEEKKNFMVPPIQRVESSVKRDVLDLDRFSDRPVHRRHASVIAIDEGSAGSEGGGVRDGAGRYSGPGILAARVPRETGHNLSKMKSQYHGINSKSLKTYRGVLGLVNGKIGMIKHVIRKYVLVNF
ncbi:MAG: polysaccharide deacetylase family protein [Spirochaetes bacterium]|nr:polysaccharide deacetylase family protein [Spirochaetota bacterium]